MMAKYGKVWRGGARLLLAATICLLVVSEAAQAQRSFQFDVFLRGFRVGEVKFESRFDGDGYKIQGAMGSRGFFGSFLATRYSGAVIGKVVNGRYVPEVFRGRLDQKRAFGQVDIEYANGGPTVVKRTPDRALQAHDVDPRSLNNVLDPITATYALMSDVSTQNLCRTNFRLYEGSRVSSIRLSPGNSDDANVRSCVGNYTRIAGFTRAQMSERTVFPFRLNYEQLPNGRWRVQRFAMTTYWGTAQAVRTR